MSEYELRELKRLLEKVNSNLESIDGTPDNYLSNVSDVVERIERSLDWIVEQNDDRLDESIRPV